MFDFSFAEILLIVVVAVVFIGPKELPAVIKAVSKAMRGMRAISKEIRQAFDELAEESGLKETADQINSDVRMIKGDDGKYYEAYDVTQILPPSVKKSNE